MRGLPRATHLACAHVLLRDGGLFPQDFYRTAPSLCGTLGTCDSSSASSLGSRWDSHLWRGRDASGPTACPADLSHHSSSPYYGLAHRGGGLGQTVGNR